MFLALLRSQRKQLFLEGSGGTGKTFSMNLVLNFPESKEKPLLRLLSLQLLLGSFIKVGQHTDHFEI